MSLFPYESQLLIDGEILGARAGRRFDDVNPATEQVIGSAADATTEDLDLAITAARRAFDLTSWPLDRAFHTHCLGQLQDALRREADVLRQLLVAEAGAPISLTRSFQLDWAIEHDLGSALQLMDCYEWEVDRGVIAGQGGAPSYQRTVIKEPRGVVGIIVPWNFPVQLLLAKLGPVLATGNTCVVKAAPDTPFSAAFIGRVIAEQTDIPAGVVNVITSSDHLVGEALVASPLVDQIAFTGSVATGKRVMAIAAANVTNVFLELGGKSPMVVLDDADLSAVLPGTTRTCLHAGQGCSLPTRLLVPRSTRDEAYDILEGTWSAIPLGDPTDPANIAGPLINAAQRQRVLGYIEDGVAEGNRLLVGGGRPAGLPRGYYVEPTLFVDVEPDARIAREEIFGPVLVVIPFDDDNHAVRIANDTNFGLAASVFGGDLDRATRVARSIRAGTVGVNGAGGYLCDMPFGGYKQSGIGRQWGIEGFDELVEAKSLSVPI